MSSNACASTRTSPRPARAPARSERSPCSTAAATLVIRRMAPRWRRETDPDRDREHQRRAGRRRRTCGGDSIRLIDRCSAHHPQRPHAIPCATIASLGTRRLPASTAEGFVSPSGASSRPSPRASSLAALLGADHLGVVSDRPGADGLHRDDLRLGVVALRREEPATACSSAPGVDSRYPRSMLPAPRPRSSLRVPARRAAATGPAVSARNVGADRHGRDQRDRDRGFGAQATVQGGSYPLGRAPASSTLRHGLDRVFACGGVGELAAQVADVHLQHLSPGSKSKPHTALYLLARSTWSGSRIDRRALRSSRAVGWISCPSRATPPRPEIRAKLHRLPAPTPFAGR